ncbi:flagellar basal body rod C-terminal domain-containing protein [Pseudokineococcus marinus]|uniref:Flagellar basal-body rod protein FlgC n=1 Tax=Pseudokineococcus marinus TaxID=351215 RepID=A0A849BRB4_9ACTN|nr:flagellar basal body rod C-terminal domain-containing protein [Pseudokineococcus marinus]NNH24055.1 flagellar basal-body rod protein FlgC [Pseudokineococcus marinus]
MTIFQAIGIAGTGATVHRKWLDAISDNIANVNTARPTTEAAYQEKRVLAEAVDYGTGTGGVRVAGIAAGSSPEGRLVYEPNHPYADAEGYVRYPDVDLSSQMSQMIMAQRGYQANLAVVDRARESYMAALRIGGGA